MFYVILLILTLVPFLSLIFISTQNKHYNKITKLILYIWIIVFIFFFLVSAVYFSGFIIVIIFISPILLRFFFNKYKNLYYIKEISDSFHNIFSNFINRGIPISLLTILSIFIFFKFNYLNTGIYLATFIFIILIFNMQNSLNKNFGLYFILATFWSFLSSSGNIQTNLLIIAISLFIPLVPMSIYKPFARNTFIHIFSFLIFICLYEILKSTDLNELTQLLIKLISTLSVLLLGISLLFFVEKKFIKISNYYFPLIFVGILLLLQKMIFINLFSSIFLECIDSLINALLIITCLRVYGYFLANSYEYTAEKENISLYTIHQTNFSNWIGQTLGDSIWKITLGNPIKKNRYYLLELPLALLIILFIFFTHQSHDTKLEFSFNTLPWEALYILFSLQLINSLFSIKVWFHLHGNIDEKASNTLTSKMFVSILSILICIVIQNWHIFNDFNLIVFTIFALAYFSSLAICFFNLSIDLLNFNENKNLKHFKVSLAPLLMLISLNLSLLAYFYNITNINITYISLAIVSLILGLISGKLSNSIFSISKFVITKFSKTIIVFLLLPVIIEYPFALFMTLYYFGYYITSSD